MANKVLSVLCITKCEPHAAPILTALAKEPFVDELVIVYDARERNGQVYITRSGVHGPVHPDESRFHMPVGQGILEEVHDAALKFCSGDYVLRLDDDERVSEGMRQWLVDHQFESYDHWKFARAHVWGRPDRALVWPELWPDHQTRLSVKAKMGGRNHIHAGSPHGGGRLAPGFIEHYKFYLKSQAERQAIGERYDAVLAGAGLGSMKVFTMPEDVIGRPYNTTDLATLEIAARQSALEWREDATGTP